MEYVNQPFEFDQDYLITDPDIEILKAFLIKSGFNIDEFTDEDLRMLLDMYDQLNEASYTTNKMGDLVYTLSGNGSTIIYTIVKGGGFDVEFPKLRIQLQGGGVNKVWRNKNMIQLAPIKIEPKVERPLIQAPNVDVQAVQNCLESWSCEFETTIIGGAYDGLKVSQFQNYCLCYVDENGTSVPKLVYSEYIELINKKGHKGELTITGERNITPEVWKIILAGNIQDPNELQELIHLLMNEMVDGNHQILSQYLNVPLDELKGFSMSPAKVYSILQFIPASYFSKTNLFVGVDLTFTYAAILLAERLGYSVVTSPLSNSPESKNYASLAEAQAVITELSFGYAITLENDGTYKRFELSAEDLHAIAVYSRGEGGLDVGKRYDFFKKGYLIDFDAFEMPTDGFSLDQRLMLLKGSYYDSLDHMEVMEEFRQIDQVPSIGFIYKTWSGYLSVMPLAEQTAFQLKAELDNIGYLPEELEFWHTRLKPVMIFVQLDEGANILRFDKRHYDGITKFYSFIIAAEKSGNPKDFTDNFEQDDDAFYAFLNEALTPNKYQSSGNSMQNIIENIDANVRGAIQSKLAEDAWSLVSGMAEKTTIKLMTEMKYYLEGLAEVRMLLVGTLGQWEDMTTEEQEQLLEVAAKDDTQIVLLKNILNDKEKRMALCFGNEEVDALPLKISLEEMQTNIAAKAIEMDGEIKSLEAKFSGSTNFREQIIAAPGEMGDYIREVVYHVNNFDLDPTKFPHDDLVTNQYTLPGPMDKLKEDPKNLMQQLYVNQAVAYERQQSFVEMLQNVTMVAGVFTLARRAALWAVKKMAVETFKARAKRLIIESAVFALTTGALMEGIKVAMGGTFSWASLGFTTLEAFLAYFAFGMMSIGIPNPFVRFGSLALGFIGYTLGRFYLTHGNRLPHGFEWTLFLTENILLIGLVAMATKVTDTMFGEIKGYGLYDAKLKDMVWKIQRINGKIAKESAKTKPDAIKLKTLGDEFVIEIAKYKEYITEHMGTNVSPKMPSYLKGLQEAIEIWGEVRDAHVTKLTYLDQTKNVFTYKGDQASIEALKIKFKDSAKVGESDANGVIKILTAEGETAILIPEKYMQNALEKGPSELIEGFGDTLRMLDHGVYAIRPGKVAEVKAKYNGTGEWHELGDGTYLGKKTSGKGKNAYTESTLFIQEKNSLTYNNAVAYQETGNGLAYYKSTLNLEAQNGLELIRLERWSRLSDADILTELGKLNDKAYAMDHSVQSYLALFYRDTMYLYEEYVALQKSQSKTPKALKIWLQEKYHKQNAGKPRNIQNVRFKKMNSIVSAQSWAKDKLALEKVDYSGMDLGYANKLNQNLLKIFQKYPLKNGVKKVQTKDSRTYELDPTKKSNAPLMSTKESYGELNIYRAKSPAELEHFMKLVEQMNSYDLINSNRYYGVESIFNKKPSQELVFELTLWHEFGHFVLYDLGVQGGLVEVVTQKPLSIAPSGSLPKAAELVSRFNNLWDGLDAQERGAIGEYANTPTNHPVFKNTEAFAELFAVFNHYKGTEVMQGLVDVGNGRGLKLKQASLNELQTLFDDIAKFYQEK